MVASMFHNLQNLIDSPRAENEFDAVYATPLADLSIAVPSTTTHEKSPHILTLEDLEGSNLGRGQR